ncbi:motility associated factor glycosyltransferase family protein [Alteromonas australica]|uniref:motility associated factor glycosyltransferase family protein n=1 Tax=Alteromonas australica TaxID=589873 RepID=UPI0035C82060
MLNDIRLHVETDELKQKALEEKLSRDIISNYKSNALAFSQFMPSVMNYVENSASQNISVFVNKNAQYNMVDYSTGKTVYGLRPEEEIIEHVELFSKHAPNITINGDNNSAFNVGATEKPAISQRLNQYKQLEPLPQQVDVLVIFGLGLGLHIEKLVEDNLIKHLVIYEPEIQHFKCSLFTFDWQRLFKLMKSKGTTIYLQLEHDGRDIVENVNELAEHIGFDRFYFYKHFNHYVFDAVTQSLISSTWNQLCETGITFGKETNPNLFLPKWSAGVDLSNVNLLDKNNEKFNSNLSAFKVYFPQIFQEFSDYTPTDWIPIQLSDGQIDVIRSDSLVAYYGGSPKSSADLRFEYFEQYPQKDGLVLGYNGTKLKKYHHYQFVEKTEKLLDEISEHVGKLPDTVKSLVMFGVGVGYQINTLYDKKNVEKLFLCEPNKDFFYSSLFAVDWQTILSNIDKNNQRLYINIGDDGTNLFRDLLSQFYSIGPYILASTYIYEGYQNDYLNNSLSQLREQLKIVISMGEYYDHAKYGISHTTEIISRGTPILQSKADKYLSLQDKDVPVFIVGNGPSLDDSIDTIKELKDRAIVVSCGTALMPLYKNGIVPDFHAEIEQNRSTFDWICRVGDFDYLKQINLISCNGIHPDTCDLFKNVYISFKAGESSTVSALNILGRENYEELEYAFPTVSNFVVNIFSTIGFNQIYLMGVDLGFFDRKKHHSKQSGYYKKNGKEMYDYREKNNTSILVPGNFRKTVFTKHEFKVSKEILEQTLASRKIDCFNTSDGARIAHSVPLTIDNILLTNSEVEKKEAIAAIVNRVFRPANEFEKYSEQFQRHYLQENLAFELDGLIELVELPITSTEEAEALINKQKDLLFASYSNGKSLMFYLLFGTLNYANSVLSKIINSRADSWLEQTECFQSQWLEFLRKVKGAVTENLLAYDFCSSFCDKREHIFMSRYTPEETILVKTDPDLEPKLFRRLQKLSAQPEMFAEWEAIGLDDNSNCSGIIFTGERGAKALDDIAADIESGRLRKLLICGFNPAEIRHIDFKQTQVSYVFLGDFLFNDDDYRAMSEGNKPLIVGHRLAFLLMKCFMSCELYELFTPKVEFFANNIQEQQNYVSAVNGNIGELDGFVEFSSYIAVRPRIKIRANEHRDKAGNLGVYYKGNPRIEDIVFPLSKSSLTDELAFHEKGAWHLVD